MSIILQKIVDKLDKGEYYIGIGESEVIHMNEVRRKDNIKEKKSDAEELIMDVIKKIPEGRKIEALRLLEGFSLSDSDTKKAG